MNTISLKTASGTVPTPKRKLKIAEPEKQSSGSFSNSIRQSSIRVSIPNASASLAHPPPAIESYTKKKTALDIASDAAKRIDAVSERTNALQKAAQDYLALLKALIDSKSYHAMQLSLRNNLRDLIACDIIPLYLQGYISVKWFQDYTFCMQNFVEEQDEKSERIRVKLYRVKLHALTSSNLDWHYPKPNSFEEKIGYIILYQLHYLSSFLKEDLQALPILLSRMEEVCQDCYMHHPDRLIGGTLADAYIFLIQHGRTASVEAFLRAYQEIYHSLQHPSLDEISSLCLGWKRFFELKCTEIEQLWDLYLKDAMGKHRLVALYLDSLEIFQEACERCAELLKRYKSHSCYSVYKADLVACLRVGLTTVQAWKPGMIANFPDFWISRGDEQFAARAYTLQHTINEKTRPLLGDFAQEYLCADASDAQAAQAINAFLIRT